MSRKALITLFLSTVIIFFNGCNIRYTNTENYNDDNNENESSIQNSNWTKLSGTAGAVTNGYGIAIDSSGNNYLVGWTNGNLDGQTLNGNQDSFVIKYNSSGIKQWTKLSGVTGADTNGFGIASDSSNNIYIVGLSSGNLDGETLNGDVDAFVTKYNSSGVKQWTRLSGVTLGATNAFDIAVDSLGNSYITGWTNGNLDGETLTGTKDVFVIKYNSSGVKQWTKLLGVAGGETSGSGITVDSSGNSYIVGSTSGDLDGNTLTGLYDVFIVKYNSSGVKQWTKLSGVAGVQTEGNDVAIDSYGNSYVTGLTYGNLDGQTMTGSMDAFLIKYNSSGVKQWTKLSGVAGAETAGVAITVDLSDNAYIVGNTGGNLDGETLTGTYDIFAIKYNSSGIKLWTKLLGVAGEATAVEGITLDSAGNNYITGNTGGNLDGEIKTGDYDVFLTTRLNQ